MEAPDQGVGAQERMKFGERLLHREVIEGLAFVN
jgi:hypothetical protein